MGVDGFRAKLGMRLVFWSTIALVALAGVVMVGAIVAESRGSNGAVLDAARLLFSSLLPLFGTWVGTILAFYYTKENFEAASRGTLDVVRTVAQRLNTTPVTDVMMPRSKIISVTAPDGLRELAITEVEKKFEAEGENGQRISRLLILDAGGACVGILHRSVFNEILANGLRSKPPVDPTADKLGKLLELKYPAHSGKTYLDFVRDTVAYVGRERSLADAKAAMEQRPGCQDVVVTATGDRTEAVLGWISNVDIGRLSHP